MDWKSIRQRLSDEAEIASMREWGLNEKKTGGTDPDIRNQVRRSAVFSV